MTSLPKTEILGLAGHVQRNFQMSGEGVNEEIEQNDRRRNSIAESLPPPCLTISKSSALHHKQTPPPGKHNSFLKSKKSKRKPTSLPKTG